MTDGAKQSGAWVILAGLGAALVTGLLAYVAAKIQSDAAIKAAIEGKHQPTTAYVADGGIWVLGGDEHHLVYCRLKPDLKPDMISDQYAIICSKSAYVGTF